jgi:VCBS repeat-containing protein
MFSNGATVSITVRPVNDAPLAGDDAYATDEDTPLEVPGPGVLGNDFDPEGDTLGGLTLVGNPAHGTLQLDPDGAFIYTPDPNYSGADSFRYKVSDGMADSEVATVSIAVQPVNDAPVAGEDAHETDEDTLLSVSAPGVLGNDHDVDGEALSAVLVSGPTHGALVLDADGSFTYRPEPNFAGVDSFRYKGSDGTADSEVAPVVRITVRQVNDAPLARDDEYATHEDEPLTVPAPGVRGNDTDPDGDALGGTAVVSSSAHGSLDLHSDGSFTYLPERNFTGADSFTYEVSDGATTSNAATVSITVQPVNDPPVARDDAYETDDGTRLIVPGPGVLANDGDPDGDALTSVSASAPAHGALDLNPDGSFVYTPTANFAGIDSFRYRASDGEFVSGDAALVSITVGPVDRIVFASGRTGNGDIYSVDPRGGAPTRLTSAGAIDAEPVWSPNRTRIAFTSTRNGNVDIYAMNTDGSNVTRLTTSSAIDTSPAWSPDGTRIAFTSNRAGGNRDIYVMSAAGDANATRLTTHTAADTVPTWSPDGSSVAFASGRTGGGDIYAMAAVPGSAQTRVTTSPGADREPDWFGSTIAFATNRHGNFEIYTMHQSGTGQTRRTTQAGDDVTPAWSPDGTKLAFATNRHGGLNFELYTMDPDGTGQARLTTHPAIDALPDW